jgi:hypothetical protein
MSKTPERFKEEPDLSTPEGVRRAMQDVIKEGSATKRGLLAAKIQEADICNNSDLAAAARDLVDIFNDFIHITEEDIAILVQGIPNEILDTAMSVVNQLIHTKEVEASIQDAEYKNALQHAKRKRILCTGMMGPTGGIMPSMEGVCGSPSAVLGDLKRAIEKKLRSE